MILADSGIIRAFLDGNPDAEARLRLGNSISLSVITFMDIMETRRGDPGETGRIMLKKGFRILHIRDEISFKAFCLFREYSEKTGLTYGRAFIAATALHYHLELLTDKPELYSAIPGIRLFLAPHQDLTSSKSIKSA